MQDYVIYYLREGIPLSEEHRKRISEALKGKKKSPAHRAAIAKSITAWWRDRKQVEREKEERRRRRKRPYSR
jgi:hypothetical protein